MSRKKTVCLQDTIAKVAEQKAKMVSGGNFSSYISMLIFKDNEQDIKRFVEAEENRKPVRVAEILHAKYASECTVCKKSIHVGNQICCAKFADDSERYVHKDCSRDSHG